MSSIAPFDPIVPGEYRWKSSPDSPKLWRRPLANEAMWCERPKDSRDLFVYASLTFKFPIFRNTLSKAIGAAWQRLQHDVPALLLTTGTDPKDGKRYILYESPQNQEEVNQWAVRTSAFAFGAEQQSFEDLRSRVLSKKRSNHADNVYLFSHARFAAESLILVSGLQVMIYLDHLVTDGIGARILLGRYLSLLSFMISTPTQFKFEWQENHKLLSQPWICLMTCNQELSGIMYNNRALWNQEILTEHMKNNHGLPLLRAERPETQETYFITLSEAQSTSLLEGVKEIVGPDSNITHLGHAAMVLALLRSSRLTNSSSTSPQPLYSPCWLNGRRYLRPSDANPFPTQDYIPLCISFAPIVFPDLKEISLSRSANRAVIKSKLAKACKIATEQYGNIKRQKSILPESVLLFESFGEKMRARQQNQMSTEDQHVAAPMSKVQPISTKTADPFFLSDGITEQYIARQYFATSGVNKIKLDRPIFEVDDVKFAANADDRL